MSDRMSRNALAFSRGCFEEEELAHFQPHNEGS